MRGNGRGSYAWFAIAVLAGLIIVGVYFVVPEYREEVLGIKASPEKKEIILDVNKVLGNLSLERRILRHTVPFSLKYLIKEKVESSGSFKISSNIFRIGSIEVTLGNDEYIIIRPVKVSGKLILKYNGKKEELIGERKIFGPTMIIIRNELLPFQLFGTSIINYTVYRIEETPIATIKEINFEIPYDVEDSRLKILFSGNCNLKLFVNDKMIFNGTLPQSINIGSLKKGKISIAFVAMRGTDCKIESISLELNPEKPKVYLEKSFGEISGERIRIMLDISKNSEDLNYTLTFIGKRRYQFENPVNNTVEIDKEDLSETNIIRISVKSGWMYLKRIVIIGE